MLFKDYIYLRHVPVMKVHLFTFIQMCGLSVLWIIKSTKPVSIVFPLMVAAIVGIRMVSLYSNGYGILNEEEFPKEIKRSLSKPLSVAKIKKIIISDIRLLSQGLLPTRAQLAGRHYSRSGKTRKGKRKN